MANQQKTVSVTLNKIAYIGVYKVTSNFVTISYGKYHKSIQLGTFNKEQTPSLARLLLRELIKEKIE